MKKNLKASTFLAPVPVVMVTCGDEEKSNVITLAWVGTVNSDPPMVSISVRYGRYSYPIIKEKGEFTINLVDASLVEATDRCGVLSGRDGDKFFRAGLTKVPGVAVKTPYIAESPASLECKVVQETDFGSHAVFLAEIVNVIADEKYVGENGSLQLPDGLLVAYANGKYVATGKTLGTYAYTAKKKQ